MIDKSLLYENVVSTTCQSALQSVADRAHIPRPVRFRLSVVALLSVMRPLEIRSDARIHECNARIRHSNPRIRVNLLFL